MMRWMGSFLQVLGKDEGVRLKDKKHVEGGDAGGTPALPAMSRVYKMPSWGLAFPGKII